MDPWLSIVLGVVRADSPPISLGLCVSGALDGGPGAEEAAFIGVSV